MDLIDEQLLAAVRSNKNVNQDSSSEEVVNTASNGSICWPKTNPYRYFELGR